MELPPRWQNGLYRSSAPTNSLGNASTPQLNPSEHTSFACACISMPSATLCPAVLVGHFLSRHRICSLVIRGPIRNLRIIHFTPALHFWIHEPAKPPIPKAKSTKPTCNTTYRNRGFLNGKTRARPGAAWPSRRLWQKKSTASAPWERNGRNSHYSAP